MRAAKGSAVMSGIASALRAAPREPAGADLDDLLQACAAGDRAALRAIYECEGARMLGVAIRILRRREIAEEALQDTFVQIWTRAASFDPSLGTARSWIFAVLRHRALHILRRSMREIVGDDDALFECPDDGPDPEAIVIRLKEGSRLRRCLEGLAADRRQAIVLAYAAGLSHGEIAGRMGRPLGTVKAWLRRSLLALRDCMQ
jgi:RNA polymerase sigma-70 factor (ECF subfamily)